MKAVHLAGCTAFSLLTTCGRFLFGSCVNIPTFRWCSWLGHGYLLCVQKGHFLRTDKEVADELKWEWLSSGATGLDSFTTMRNIASSVVKA